MASQIRDAKIEEELYEGTYDTRPVIDRYYTKKFLTGPRGNDYTYLIHSNKLCVITLAPSHPILTKDLTVTSVKFQVSEKVDRLKNAVSGKGKKGGQYLTEKSVLCMINCEGETEPFVVPAGVHAKLLEVNESLVGKPELLKAASQGYIAIISPRTSDFEAQIKKLLSAQAYQAQLTECQTSTI